MVAVLGHNRNPLGHRRGRDQRIEKQDPAPLAAQPRDDAREGAGDRGVHRERRSRSWLTMGR